MNTATRRAVKEESPTGASESLWTVFLVDDDLDDIVLSACVLEHSPEIGEIVPVANGAQLFSELQKRHVEGDLLSAVRRMIMLDIHMPGQNGMDLLEQLKSGPYEHIPVIMLSGDYRTDNIEKSSRMKANAFITKPLSKDHLGRIHAVLSRTGNGRELF